MRCTHCVVPGVRIPHFPQTKSLRYSKSREIFSAFLCITFGCTSEVGALESHTRSHTTRIKNQRQTVAVGSATGTRTPVYGVRGRCPRPLDDSTVTLCHTSFSKASAKVLLFFDMTKYFRKKMQKKCIFYVFWHFFDSKHAAKPIFFCKMLLGQSYLSPHSITLLSKCNAPEMVLTCCITT